MLGSAIIPNGAAGIEFNTHDSQPEMINFTGKDDEMVEKQRNMLANTQTHTVAYR